MLKAVFFDNDGVLVDTERLYFEATRRVLAKRGVELTREMFCEFFLVQNCGAFHLLGTTEDEVENVRRERNAIYSELLRTTPSLVSGAPECLERLSASVILGLVTSSLREHLNLIHLDTTLLPRFDFVLAHGDYARSKPSPDPYLAALARSGCAAPECLVIEDSLRGLNAASAAGLRCWIIRSELTAGCDFSAAERVFDDLRGLSAELFKEANVL